MDKGMITVFYIECKILIIWLQLSFSFMYLTPTVYTAVNIVDLGDVGVSSNPFYVDDVSLIAYEHDFSVNVLDACGQNLTVPFSLNYFAGLVFFLKLFYILVLILIIWIDYEASFETTTPSCMGQDDGTITATVAGGSSPYKYLLVVINLKNFTWTTFDDNRFSWTINGTDFATTNHTMTGVFHSNDTITGLPKLVSNAVLFSNGQVTDGWTVENTTVYSLCNPACMFYYLKIYILY